MASNWMLASVALVPKVLRAGPYRGVAAPGADRLCLALGQRLEVPVVTTDGAWESVRGVPEIILIR